MAKVSLVYISLSGNTASFIKRLTAYLQEGHVDLEVEQVNIKDLVKEGPGFLCYGQSVCSLLTDLFRGWKRRGLW